MNDVFYDVRAEMLEKGQVEQKGLCEYSVDAVRKEVREEAEESPMLEAITRKRLVKP
jgi:hypothetical protein